MTRTEQIAFATMAVGCAIVAAYALKTGRAIGRYSTIARKDNPSGYWTLVILYAACAVLFSAVSALPFISAAVRSVPP